MLSLTIQDAPKCTLCNKSNLNSPITSTIHPSVMAQNILWKPLRLVSTTQRKLPYNFTRAPLTLFSLLVQTQRCFQLPFNILGRAEQLGSTVFNKTCHADLCWYTFSQVWYSSTIIVIPVVECTFSSWPSSTTLKILSCSQVIAVPAPR